MDWMGRLVKNKDVVEFHYRFRYYKDDNAFSQNDVKNWYTVKGGKENQLEKMFDFIETQIIPVIERQLGNKVDRVSLECTCSDPKMLFELGSRPWAHVKMLSKEEAEKQGYTK
jgi:hypothetical protein